MGLDLSVSILAAGRVGADGRAIRILGASTQRVRIGHYRIIFDSPPPDDTYPILATLEVNAGADDYIIHYDASAGSFDLFVTEQDNASGSGRDRDCPFSFFVPNIY